MHIGAGGGAEFQQSGHGFSTSVGAGVSIAPIPYFQVKFGYTRELAKWNLSKIKNNKSSTFSKWWIPNSKVKITKKPDRTEVYIYKAKKTIGVFTKNKKIKVC